VFDRARQGALRYWGITGVQRGIGCTQTSVICAAPSVAEEGVSAVAAPAWNVWHTKNVELAMG